MSWQDAYDKNYVKLEWKEHNEPREHLLAHKDEDIKLDDIPIMFVGIGGTGIDAVISLKNKLEGIYHPEVLKRIEYLLIDTDKIGENRNIDEADTIVVQSTDTAMLLREAKSKNSFVPEEIRSWLDPNLSPFRVMNGAAGIRQAGRLILFLNIQRICNILEHKLSKISAGYDGCECRPRVYLFAGIGGGTGSGMFVDISYLIKSVCPNLNVDLEGIIFMPDVSCLKPNLREVHKQNIIRNGFAALKELDYLMNLDRLHESFEQKYTDTISVKSQDPIFDTCILVGAQEDGRRPIEKEQDIFDKVAEYVLFEIQDKQGFGLESYKSNIVNIVSNEPFCERYVAIGAAAKYIPVDYYFGWWLSDVFSQIEQGNDFINTLNKNTTGSSSDLENNAIYNGLKEKLLSDFLERVKRNTEWKNNTIKEQWKDDLKQTCEENNGWFPGEREIYALLLLSKEDTSSWKELKEKLSDDIIKGFKKGKTNFAKKRLFFKKKSYYVNCYLEAIESICSPSEFANRMKDLEGILQKVRGKIKNYTITKLPELQFLTNEETFNCIKEYKDKNGKSLYKESVTEAVLKITRDININEDKWNGMERKSPKWLSNYMGSIIHEDFEKSGLTDLMLLIERAAVNGYNGQEGFVHKCLTEIEARQLWPRSAVYPRKNDFHRVLAAPDKNTIKEWVESWQEKTGAGDVYSANEVFFRFARAIIVPGNALYSYDRIKDFEQIYINSANNSGQHLYAGKDKDWRRLASPYYQTKWRDGDEAARQTEKKLNGHYRRIFDIARRLGFIKYDSIDKSYWIVDGSVKIGDIKEASEELAKDVFVHMFTHRQNVEYACYRKAFDMALSENIIHLDDSKFYCVGEEKIGDVENANEDQAREAFIHMTDLCEKVADVLWPRDEKQSA